jgi:hypothetical protein
MLFVFDPEAHDKLVATGIRPGGYPPVLVTEPRS